jgi:hypothetical protein
MAKHTSQSGVITQAWVTCNHGTYAQNMGLKYQWKSALASKCRLGTAAICTTPYDILSREGRHNSIDDADIQYARVRLRIVPNPRLGKCSDPDLNNELTDCY